MNKNVAIVIASAILLGFFTAQPAYSGSAPQLTTKSILMKDPQYLTPQDMLRGNKLKKMLQELQPDGKVKHPHLWFAEGSKYFTGNGVPIDYSKTFEYWMLAAEAGYPKGQTGVGYLYLHGKGTAETPEEAKKWFDRAVAQEYGPAYYQLGSMYYNGIYVEQDSAHAFKLFTMGAEKGDEECIYALGLMFFAGEGTEQDYNAALKAWTRSAEAHNNKDAQYNIATMYENGLGVQRDMSKAREWYAKAARNNHAGAIAALKDIGASSGQN